MICQICRALSSRCLPALIGLALFLAQGSRCLAAPALSIANEPARGWPSLSAPGQSGMVYTVEASLDLRQWQVLAQTLDALTQYPDASAPLYPARFYRLGQRGRTTADDWKNQVQLESDSFLSDSSDFSGPDFRWIKFGIVLKEPFRVYYQDSQKYPFHYDFATKRLEGFQGLTPAQFDQRALHTNQQEILLGAVLLPPYPTETEYGIQFVGSDAYPREFVQRYFELVRATVVSSNRTAFYVPAYEQAQSSLANREFFESKGIRLAAADRWISSDDIYAHGWAVGRLKFFPGSEIAAAFADGRLAAEDILLTDGVPAEIPILAGVLSLAPSTPNSHVAILSQSFGLPFAYISDPAQQAFVQQLVGKEVLLRLDPYSQIVRVVELEASMDPALRSEIAELKTPATLHITPKEKYGKFTASTDALTPADMKYFGGKASNFGFLRREVLDHSPEAIAISFDLWDEFLDQVLPGGNTLRSFIGDRLSKYAYPPNATALEADLAEIRSTITKTAHFTAAQKQAIMEALSRFPGRQKIRFRSSTNCEDSEQFTGAGLYDSFSGCLADDEDGDEAGPSQCDSTEPDERGVFRALQKVYASFYNNNAVIERLRHQIDEAKVGMAVLVHLSAPDETELANGVATVQVYRGGGFDSLNGNLVSQPGAASVTNPDGTARPEVVQGYQSALSAGGFLSQRSSLVPLGAYVMTWDTNYIELLQLFSKVADGYHAYSPKKQEFTLDFEYKKRVPGVMEIKQVREVPLGNSTNSLPAYLVHATNQFRVMQGEFGDVFSNHRLKSFWSLHTRNLRLDGSNLLQSLFVNVEGEYLQQGQARHWNGAPAGFPNAFHRVNGDAVLDGWTDGARAEQLRFELQTDIEREVQPPRSPVFVLLDFRISIGAEYRTPQPALAYDFDGLKTVWVTNHNVALEITPAPSNKDTLQQRSASAGAVSVTTSFYWSAPADSGVIQKTFPLARWQETRIEGLTSKPILLRGEYSQTYRPGHHNFSEEFIFEPSLEAGVSETTLAELEAADVRLIHVFLNFDRKEIRILGKSGTFRTLGSGKRSLSLLPIPLPG